MSLDIDVQALFDSINQWFPVLFPVLALVGGIGIAMKLAMFLINQFKAAF